MNWRKWANERLNEGQAGEAVDALLDENERLRYALSIIAGRRSCVDNLMSNQDVAIAVLDRQE